MGLLDDAIREHLELKRRHGAEESEVKRLEEEAFGAQARPAPAPAEAPAPGPEAPAAESEAPAPEPEAEAPVAPPEPAPAPQGEDWYDEPDEVPFEDSLEHPKPQETSEFTPEEAREAVGEAPAEYVAPDEEPSDDLLEETPDFLQETPEHDRLWFEQKPPRDFDFGS